MAAPYTSQTIASYNDSPPSDDGSQTEANRVTWAKHKTKLGDPIKTLAEAINSQLSTAFGKVVGGGGITASAISYQVLAGDQGKLVKMTGASTTLTTPDATVVTSPFVFGYLNNSTGTQTLDGSGSQTVNGETSLTIQPGTGMMLWTDGSNWFGIGFSTGTTFGPPGGRLTLATATPVMATDVTGAATIYYAFHTHGFVSLWNGTSWVTSSFTELSQALNDTTKSPAAAANSSNYDMFVWNDSGTLRCTRGPAWTSDTGRGTGAGTTELERVNGVWLNKIAITNGPGANRGLYVGTIRTDGSAQCNFKAKPAAAAGGGNCLLHVWNHYNRLPLTSISRDSTDSWAYTTATLRSANNSTSNRISFLRGLDDDEVDAAYHAVSSSSTTSTRHSGVGLDATNAIASGSIAGTGGTQTAPSTHTALYRGFPGLGHHFVQALEASVAAGTTTWIGDNADAALFQSGLVLTTRM